MPLPSGGGVTSLCESNFPKVHLNLLVDSPSGMLRTSEGARKELESLGLDRPYVDAAFNSPSVYADFLRDLHERNLVKYSSLEKSYLGFSLSVRKMVNLEWCLTHALPTLTLSRRQPRGCRRAPR